MGNRNSCIHAKLIALIAVGALAIAGLGGRAAAEPAEPGSPAALAALAAPATQPAESFGQRVRADVDQWLAGFATRAVGSDEHDRFIGELVERVKAVRAEPAVRVWTQDFPLVVPRTIRAELTIGGGAEAKRYRVYPLWPALSRLNTTPAGGIRGRLVYVGQGAYDELPAAALRGQIAVMEMTGGANWQRVYSQAGAAAIILLGSDQVSQSDAHSHLVRVPLNVPRFYVPPGELADRLRSERLGPASARLDCKAEWARTEATNVYALVKGVKSDAPQPAVAIAVQADATGVVPELAAGADSAVDVSLALNLLRHYAEHPPVRPLLFVFMDGFSINLMGEREMLVALAVPPKERESYLKEDRDLLTVHNRDEQLACELGPRPDQLAQLHQPRYASLHRFIKDEVSRVVVQIEAELHPLRLSLRSAADEEREAMLAREAELTEQRRRYLACQLQLLTTRQIDPDILPLAMDLWGKVRERIRGQLADTADRLARQTARERFRLAMLDELGLFRVDDQITAEKVRLVGRADAPDEVMDLSDALRLARRADQNLVQVDAKANPPVCRIFKAVQTDEAGNERTWKTERPIGFLLGLDLSDAGVVVGPRLYCHLLGTNEAGSAKVFGRWLTGIMRQEADALWPGDLAAAVDLTALSGLESPDSFSVGTAATLTSASDSFGTPSVTWATLEAVRQRIDTPNDRADRLNWRRLDPQIRATVALLDRLAGATDFKSSSGGVSRWNRINGVIVDQSPGEPVPRVPMHDYLTTLVNGAASGGVGTIQGRSLRPTVEGVRMVEFQLTGIDGDFYFDALPGRGLPANRKKHFVQSYQIAPDGAIVRAVDLNKIGKGVRVDVDVSASNPGARRAVVFTCREMDVLGLFDPRFLINLPSGSILDARRGSKPQRQNFMLYEGMASMLLEPEIHWELLLRAGTTQNRFALLNMKPLEEEKTVAGGEDAESVEISTRHAMQGFAVGTPLPASPMQLAAQDLGNLDQRRLTKYNAAGIKSKAIDDIRERTESLLDQASGAIAAEEAALKAATTQPAAAARFAPRGGELFDKTSGALANELRAYQAVQDMANDVVRAAIFLLLALVPFSFALERLLFASPHIYRQLGGMLGIFATMTAILWSFHPAFRISNQPLMIIMAFGIIFMSLLVISIVYQKFRGQLEELRSGRAESSGARTSRGGLAVSAVKLGIANMRKRKLRTALTGATVVLITFALLCFTSVSSYVGKKELSLDVSSPFTGVLVRQPQNRALAPEALAYVEAVIGQTAQPVPRYWWANSSPEAQQWRLHVRRAQPASQAGSAAPVSAQVSLQAALGLAGAEDALTGVSRVMPDWSRFAELERTWDAEAQAGGGCYLPAGVAEQLGVRPGDKVVIAGRTLELVGVFNSIEFDDKLRMMTGEPIRPTDYSKLAGEERRLASSENLDQLASEVASGAALEPEGLPSLSSEYMAVLPARMLAGLSDLPNCSLRSIAVGVPADDGAGQGALPRAKTLANFLADRLSFPIYYGSPDGVRVVASTALTPQAPKSMLVMLIIGGLIIFNTMLNSIAERKREIHIYTSLGLAPLHVGVLFLAEAITYGLMGSIFGYIVGQGAATALSKLGWLGAITLNYSGTQAIATMFMVLVVVVLSAMVPAFMAGKLAAPSEEMKWRVPRPQGDVIRDTLPFTVTRQTANGVAVFLHEYMDAHREGSIGNFSTDNLRMVDPGGEAGGGLMAVSATVWLAPYDLGVRQDVLLTIRPTSDDADVLEIDVELVRGAGQVSSWWKLNRVFLGDLRKQLLGWRKLKAERVLEYIASGAEMLNAMIQPAQGVRQGPSMTGA